MAERSKALVSGSREPGSIPVSDLLVGFSALPTRKSTLTGNEHSRSCACPYTRKKAAPLGVMCQRIRRQKIACSQKSSRTNSALCPINPGAESTCLDLHVRMVRRARAEYPERRVFFWAQIFQIRVHAKICANSLAKFVHGSPDCSSRSFVKGCY